VVKRSFNNGPGVVHDCRIQDHIKSLSAVDTDGIGGIGGIGYKAVSEKYIHIAAKLYFWGAVS
jgi:hypothetical protein